MNKVEPLRTQLLQLVYEKRDEVFANSEQDEFDCLVALIEYGDITSFEELAAYGVER